MCLKDFHQRNQELKSRTQLASTEEEAVGNLCGEILVYLTTLPSM